MRRLFLRTYVALAAVVLLAVGLATATHMARRRPPDPPLFEALLDAPDLVRTTFDAKPVPEAIRALREEHGVDAHAHPMHRLPPWVPPHTRVRLERGQVAGPEPGGPHAVWVPLLDLELAVVVHPDRPPPPLGPWILAGLLVALGVVVGIQLVPLDRDLSALATAAREFGGGASDVRVALKSRSPTYELGASFNSMAERIGALLDGQRELLLAVSHELRTPVNRVRFAAELLAEEADPSARRDRVDEVQRDLDELDALVAELLEWGKLTEPRALSRKSVELMGWLHGLVEPCPTLRPEVRVDLDGPAMVTVLADPAALRRAVLNLLHNAVRHARGRVHIQLELKSNDVCIHVDDDGAGIPAADRERVKEPFVRLDAARSPERGGVGLGLALAARIAEAHGGTLVVADAPMGGARLTLTLPHDPADSA